MKNQMSLGDIKNNSSKVIAKVKDLLNVGCSPTHALDIAAVACGYKDYQTAKGLLGKKSFYHITTNVGTAEVPFLIERPLGFFKNDTMAQYKFRDEIESCKMDAEWQLFRDGVATDYYRLSMPFSKDRKGLAMTVRITGETESDLVAALDFIAEDVSSQNGSNGNEKIGYSFTKYGEEVVPNVYDINESYHYVIISETGFAIQTDEEEQAEEAFAHAGEPYTDIVHWRGDLIFLELISVDDFDDYEADVVLVDRNGREFQRMTFANAEDYLNYSEQTFYVYREIKRKGAMNR